MDNKADFKTAAEPEGALEALQRIKDAEAGARVTVREAREKLAAEILQESYSDAQRIKSEALAAARRDGELRKTALIESAAQEASAIRKATEEEKVRIRKSAEPLIPAAVEETAGKIKRILEGGSV
ncbi:MAG: hypothetical protein PHX45_10685 [Acidobacteriota bacterium]|nr:hypothetical protein [Acidobacteriota bacterium]